MFSRRRYAAFAGSRRVRPLAVVLCATLLVCSVAAVGAASPDGQTGTDGCTTIDSPGEYVLTRDVRAPPGTGVCLHVRASDVIVRGDGHRIVAEEGGTVGVGAGSRGGVSNVTVANLTVEGWRVGVGYGNVDGGALDGVEAHGNEDGVRLARARNVQVSDVVAEGNGGTGLSLSDGSRNNAVTGVVAAENHRGIRLRDASGNRFEDVTVRRFSPSFDGSVGVSLVDSARNRFVDATIRGNPNDAGYDGSGNVGVRVEGGVENRFADLVVGGTDLAVRFDRGRGHAVSNATLVGNAHAAFVNGSDGFSLRDSNVTDNGDGIDLRGVSGGRIVSTRSVDNGFTGIDVSDSAVEVVGCVVRYNGGSGVALSGANGSAVADTVASGNGAHGVDLSGTSDARITNVTASWNRFDGVNVTAFRPGGWPVAAADNTVTNSTVADNARDGVGVSEATGTRLRGVTAAGNRVGIRLAASSGTAVVESTGRDSAAEGVLVTGSNDAVLDGVTASGNVDSGVRVVGSDGVHLSNVAARRNFASGIEVDRSNRTHVRASRAADNNRYGVAVEGGRDARVRNVAADDNAITGIRLRHVDGWEVADSVASDNEGGAGIAAITSDGAATGNRVTGNARGIEVIGTNNTLSDNVAERNRGDGFALTTFERRGHNVVRNNTAVGNGETGVDVSHGTHSGGDVVANNTVRNNGGRGSDGGFRSGGIRVGSYSARVVGNLVADNEGAGVVVGSTGITVGDNRVVDNARAGVELVGTDEARVVGNHLSNNEYGVHVGYEHYVGRMGESVFPATETTVGRNDVAGSERADVLIQGARETRVVDNTLVGSGVGVRVEPVEYTQYDFEGNVHRRVAHATGTELHGNRIANHGTFGVDNRDTVVVNATDNDWGAPDGPSSPTDPDAPFADPTTGTLADGSGDAVSEDPNRPGVSNVRFDPFVENASAVGPSRGERAAVDHPRLVDPPTPWGEREFQASSDGAALPRIDRATTP